MPKILRPYQATSLDRARVFHRLPLFLQMRLGKCIVSIRWALTWTPARVLVVAPLTTLRGWQEDLDDEGLGHVTLLGTPKQRYDLAATSDAQWHLVNYEGLRGLREKTDFADLPYDVVILDESTCIKNRVQVTRDCQELFAHVPYRAILSGEPTPEGIEDIFEQFKFLDGHFMGHDNFFKWRFENFQREGFAWFPKPGALSRIKKYYQARSVILSRKEAGVFDDKTYQRRYVTLPRDTLAGIEECLGAFEFTEADGVRDSTKYAIVAAGWALRLCGGFTPFAKRQINTAKQTELLKLLRGELSKEPVVVWFAYRAELDAAHAALLKAGVSVAVVHGGLKAPDRFAAIALFQRGAVRVILSTVACARFGLNFSRADTEIYFSNSVKFELRNQSEDRLVYLDKKKTILVIDLVAADTPDEDLVTLLLMKKVEARALKRNFDARLAERVLKAKERLLCKNRNPRIQHLNRPSRPGPKCGPPKDDAPNPASVRIRLVIAGQGRSTRNAAPVRTRSASRPGERTRTPSR